GVHALFQVIARGGFGQRLFFFLVAGEDLGVTRQQALLRVRPELDFALATHREARLAREVRVLVGLADDQLHSVAVARGDAGLVAVASTHELGEPARQLRFEQTEPNAARRLGHDAVLFALELADAAPPALGAAAPPRRRLAPAAPPPPP